MTISIFKIKPDNVPGITSGNIYANQATPLAAIREDTSSLLFGVLDDGTFFLNNATFMRLEIDLPAGAKINGLRIQLASAVNRANLSLVLSGGWCKRQNNAKPWEGPNGIREWDTGVDVPFGAFMDLAAEFVEAPEVFHGDAPAFANELFLTVGTPQFADWSFVEGTLTGLNPVTGLISQLEGYLAASEGNRGDTEPNAISALFQTYNNPLIEENQHQFVWSQTAQILPDSALPQLVLDWNLPFAIVEPGGNAVRRLTETGGNAARRLTATGGNATRIATEAGGNAARRLTATGGNATRATIEAGGDVEIGEECL